ncbi:uncharacterized protein C8A04DRAFT_14204 [Dichotomopilus funicola]|uniref:RanBD1 domain-containing protein n=1 Tax=Dichotomopilus funicola TaxID=1934379 RepID=A0AAN6ZKU4_9PEZI|nr:hypothetical protein C8A04DRAFT_14204 [Dichotomopilus funicola]
MDTSSTKRSIFAFAGGLFRSPAPPADNREDNASIKNNTTSNTPTKSAASAAATARREIHGASSGPHSPMKRASEAQLASRRILGRPQGPSSKLSQSISASDLAHRHTNLVVAPPRRMPGDNPNKQRPTTISNSVLSHGPSTGTPKSTSFSGVGSTPARNLFRSSALYGRPQQHNFSPRIPANTLNQSFPPSTPGKPPRGSTPDVNGRILANTTSVDLFQMRISSPPLHLTGEYLAKEVPEDPNRTGSVYADEYLAHYCPPDLDEHQRRQFFCILDLRRLKYAADEVFTKKDWKLNVLNFAKEYEKSRSLIMLRYGLYEFKTVRASEAVKKEWKQKHGIPDSEDEATTPRAKGATKRKASEELTPAADNPFAASVSGSNKRARAPDNAAKNKRKAEAQPEDSQPAKLQKPAAPPSATKSVFESIANNAQSTSATPTKASGKSVFASGAAAKPISAFGASSGGNIFGHLSDASKGSGNEDDDDDSATGSEAEDEDEDNAGDESEEPRDTSQSDEPAESGADTPRFLNTHKPAVNGMSSASSDAGESTQGRSIFDRITRGSDGQPIRKLSPTDGNLFAAPSDNERSVSPAKEQAAATAPAAPVPAAPAAPGNNTWNAGTRIKFAPSAGSSFGASTQQKPALSSAIDFGSTAANKTTTATTPAAEAPKEAAAQPIFRAQPPKSNESTNLFAATNGTTPNLFAFGAKSTDTPAAAPSFGSNTSSLFGQPKDNKDGSETPKAAPAPSTSLFGAQPAATASDTAKPSLFASSSTSNLFGNQSKPEATPAAQPQFGGLFGKAPAPGAETPAEKPASSLCSTDATAKPATNLFGASTATGSDASAAPKFAFGGVDAKPATTTSLFGAATPAPAAAEPAVTKNLFGATTTSTVPATETKNLFGSTTAVAPATTSLFGAASTPAQDTTSLFGNASTDTEVKPIFGATNAESKPIFGSAASTTSESQPATLFTNTSSAAPIFSFGTSSTAAPAPPVAPPAGGSIFGNAGGSFNFSTGGANDNNNGAIKNPFSTDGSFSTPESFNFGTGETPSASTSFTFGAGAPTISFGGASDNGAQQQQQSVSFNGVPSSGPVFNFGGASQPSSAPIFSQNPPTAGSIFGNSLAPGGGTSTGTNSPFTFGGTSSLATTPAATTPEPSATAAAAAAEDGSKGTNADGDDAPQEQISLTGGGPGEEDESAVHEVRAKALKLVTSSNSNSDEESGGAADKDKVAKAKSSWKTMGVGPLRILKNKKTGTVRMLLRAEPRGHVALNKTVLPDFTYKAEAKYVKVTTASDDGKALETWMLQVKTPEFATALAEALEEHKKGNKK